MDTLQLTEELLTHMAAMRKAGSTRTIDGALAGELFLLHFLADNAGEATPGAMRAQTNVSSARIAQTLNRMEKKGWITRQIDPCDRRRIQVRLTDAGRGEARARDRTVQTMTASLLSALGERDGPEYVRIMGRLAQICAEKGMEGF